MNKKSNFAISLFGITLQINSDGVSRETHDTLVACLEKTFDELGIL